MPSSAPQPADLAQATRRNDDRDQRQRDVLLLLVVLLGTFACLLAAAQAAITPTRTWEVSANMLSELNPEKSYGAPIKTLVEPLRPEIMTPPAWDLVRQLTPVGRGIVVPPMVLPPASRATATPQTIAQAPTSTRATSTPEPSAPPPTGTARPTAMPRATSTWMATRALPTNTPLPTSTPLPTTVPPTDKPPKATPTNAPLPTSTPLSTVPPTDTPPTATSQPTAQPTLTPTPTASETPSPPGVATATATSTSTATATGTATATATTTSTSTPTATRTPTPTSTATSTATSTPTGTSTPTATSTATTTTDPPPAPPTGVRTAAGNREISLGWNANAEPDLAGYRVYSSTNMAGPFALQATVLRPNVGYLNTGLTNGTTYYYRVTAFDNGSHESAPSNIADATPYDITGYTYPITVTCSGVPDCSNASGPPDGNAANINGSDVITLDFGAGRGIIDGAGWDLVFYEWPYVGGIQLDYIYLDLSADGVTWYRTFAWDGVPGGVSGTNIDSYATDGNGEQENESIPSSALYPSTLPTNTGIAIDIGPWTLPGYAYRYVRFSYPPGGTDAGQIDAVQRLH